MFKYKGKIQKKYNSNYIIYSKYKKFIFKANRIKKIINLFRYELKMR